MPLGIRHEHRALQPGGQPDWLAASWVENLCQVLVRFAQDIVFIPSCSQGMLQLFKLCGCTDYLLRDHACECVALQLGARGSEPFTCVGKIAAELLGEFRLGGGDSESLIPVLLARLDRSLGLLKSSQGSVHLSFQI